MRCVISALASRCVLSSGEIFASNGAADELRDNLRLVALGCKKRQSIFLPLSLILNLGLTIMPSIKNSGKRQVAVLPNNTFARTPARLNMLIARALERLGARPLQLKTELFCAVPRAAIVAIAIYHDHFDAIVEKVLHHRQAGGANGVAAPIEHDIVGEQRSREVDRDAELFLHPCLVEETIGVGRRVRVRLEMCHVKDAAVAGSLVGAHDMAEAVESGANADIRDVGIDVELFRVV